MMCLMISCSGGTKYIKPKLDINIPPSPKLHKDIHPKYNNKLNKIEYSIADANKLLMNIKILKADNRALRIRLKGIKDALDGFGDDNE